MSKLTRRAALKWSGAAAAAMVPSALLADAPPETHESVPLWQMVELTLQGPSTGDPFQDVQLNAEFTTGSRHVQVAGFYDGSGVFRIRFMPDTEGAWSYVTRSNASALHQRRGSVTVTAPHPGTHGRYRKTGSLTANPLQEQ